MRNSELEIFLALREFLRADEPCWLNTVVQTYGSSPRPIGALLACNARGITVGSLSGGCVEEELLRQLSEAEVQGNPPERLRYGITAEENERLGLPCGGELHIVIERLMPERLALVEQICERLAARQCVQRVVDMHTGSWELTASEHFQPLHCDAERLQQTLGPEYQLWLIGAGELSRVLASMALGFAYKIRVIDPRQELLDQWPGRGDDFAEQLELIQGMPDDVLRARVQDRHNIVLALTHDPRIDDMGLIEALQSQAIYVGALGSQRTAAARRERLKQLGLNEQCIARLHAPVGLAIGAKTPAEISVAILAELVQIHRATQSPTAS